MSVAVISSHWFQTTLVQDCIHFANFEKQEETEYENNEESLTFLGNRKLVRNLEGFNSFIAEYNELHIQFRASRTRNTNF